MLCMRLKIVGNCKLVQIYTYLPGDSLRLILNISPTETANVKIRIKYSLYIYIIFLFPFSGIYDDVLQIIYNCKRHLQMHYVGTSYSGFSFQNSLVCVVIDNNSLLL